MEMTLTVHVPRRRPHPVEVVVEWSGGSTAGDLCAALAECLDEPVPRLSARGVPVPPDAVVGLPPLLHGASVAVLSAGLGPFSSVRVQRSAAVLDLVVAGGPDAGRSHPLRPPGVPVGRAPGAGLVVADDALSRRHLVVGVGPDGVTVQDCGSTNGVVLDGERLSGVRALDVRSILVAGSSTLRVRRAGGCGPPVLCPGDGTVQVSPGAPSEHVAGDLEIECPAAPSERHRPRVPWLAALAPVPVAIALAVFLGPQLLVFAALGPLSLLAGVLGDRWGSGRAYRRELARHAGDVEQARRRLALAVSSERERLDRSHSDPAATLATAELRLSALWSEPARPQVRLGSGDVPTRVVWLEGGARSRPVAERGPLVVDLGELGCLGVVGPPGTTDGILANLVGQLCVSHPPHRLLVHVASTDPTWSWAARLPHALDRPWSVLPREAPQRGAPSGAAREPVRVLVVPAPGPGTAAEVRDALGSGAVVLVAAPSATELPAGCRAVASPHEGRYVLDGPVGRQEFVADVVGAWWPDRLSRALAPLRCAQLGGGRGMPHSLSLVDCLGVPDVTERWVLQQWRSRSADHDGPSLAAVVGRMANGPWLVDLCRDGPHVLVGGTTGSGKSEFLRTLVTSLALAWSPDDLVFVLVDFKGGAAFRTCARLPHVVGLVTDLDHHLVARALASLRAELRRRERLFAAVGASDLETYQRVRDGDHEVVPRLVVVIDELKALAEELPEFVTGLVRLAALGRSLGVHLVLASQRPSGAVSAEVQANVSLRIAFRVRDRADSVDVVDDGAAAGIPSNTPGRGFARGADGELLSFQAATVGAPTRRLAGLRVRRADDEDGTQRNPAEGEPDPCSVVEVVCAAHRSTGGPLPRAPWLPPLPDVVRLDQPGAPTAGASSGHPLGAPQLPFVALVDEPDLQQVTRLRWRPEDGTWLLVGGSGSGRTTALRSLVLSAVTGASPAAVHVHAVDTHGSLSDLRALPHLGTHTAVDDLAACRALLRHLRSEVDGRLEAASSGSAAAPPVWPITVVVVDGWDQLVEAQPAHTADDLPARLLRLLRDGRSVGLVGAVSGGRSLLHPRWGGAAGHTFLLGHVDPLDAALAGLRATDLLTDPPAGRAVRLDDRREVQFVHATPADTAAVGAGAGPRPGSGAAWRRVALPAVVRRCGTAAAVLQLQVDPGPAPGTGVTAVRLGVAGDLGEPWCWRPVLHGRCLLVAGPARSGRTNTLRTVAHSVRDGGHAVAVVHLSGPVDDGWPSGAAHLGPNDADALIRLRRRHRDLAVLVDDADRLDDDAPVLPALREIVELSDRDGGLVAVATHAASLTTRFRGLDVDLARQRVALLLNPSPGERTALDTAVPAGIPRLPGRGVFVCAGDVTEVQVFLAESSPGGVAPRQHLGLGVTGDPGGPDRDDPEHDDQPALEHPGALHQAQPDGQQDDAPD